MMRTLIALLATAAMTLPAAAQQTDAQQGSRQQNDARDQGTSGNRADRSKGQARDRDGASPRAMYQERDRGRAGRDHARGRSADRDYDRGQRSEHHLRGRASYRDYDGRRGYYVRGRTTSYREYDGRPRYSYVRGRRVYYRGYSAGPRYYYVRGRRVYYRDYDGGRRNIDVRRQTVFREYDRNSRGRYEGARVEDRTRTTREESRRGVSRQGAEGRQFRETQGNHPSRSARNRPEGQTSGGQTQAEPRQNTR